MIFTLIFTAIIAYLSFYIFYFYYSRRNYPPGPFPLPFIGNTMLLRDKNRRGDLLLKKIADSYGGIVTLDVGSRYVVITDTEMVKECLVKKGEFTSDRPAAESFRIWTFFEKFGCGPNGILFASGPIWRDSRRTSLHILRDFGFGRNLMEDKIHVQSGWLIECFEKNSGKPYNPTEDICRTVGSVIVDMLLGFDFRDKKEIFDELTPPLTKFMELKMSLNMKMLDQMPFLKFIPYFAKEYNELTGSVNHIHQFFWDLTKKAESTIDYDSSEEPTNFIEAWLRKRHQAGKMDGEWSDYQLNCILADLLLAGMETTTTTLRWIIVFLVNNPEVQEKCRNEIHNVIGMEQVKMADRNNLPYTMAVLTETQRHADVVPLNVFHAASADFELGGHHIPAGAQLIPQISAILKDPKIFPNPEKFDPDRFLIKDPRNGELSLNKEKLEWAVPFSMGKRACLGESLARMELFLFAVTLLQKFNIESADGKKLPEEALLRVTLQPHQYEVIVTPYS